MNIIDLEKKSVIFIVHEKFDVYQNFDLTVLKNIHYNKSF